MNATEEWHKVGDKLTSYFGICGCQRKLKSIIDNLVSIRDKCITGERNFTGAEWLVLAMIDAKQKGHLSDAIVHGTNCEYPIIMRDHPFWKWLDEVKDSPYLNDN